MNTMSQAFAIACIASLSLGLKISLHNEGSEHVPNIEFDRKHPQDMLPEPEGQLAQVEATNLICQYGENRNKAALDDFWGILGSNTTYNDSDFTPDNTSLEWTDLGEKLDLGGSTTNWQRAKTAFPTKSLFGDGISPDDIRQGVLGDCWFLAAASGIAEVPGRMQKVFLNNVSPLNSQGIYGVNFYALGMPHTVIVDDYLPLMQNNDGTYRTKYANIGTDSSIWGAILEKAFAKYYGNYIHIKGGWPGTAVQTMLGGPYETKWHNSILVDDLWNKMLQFDSSNHILMGGTSSQASNTQGLANGHAYTVLGVKLLSNGTRLVKLRDPSGFDSFSGDWSDNSPLWTSALRTEADAVVANDGIIHMNVEYYHKNFQATDFILDPANMSRASFLKLNDTVSTGQSAWWCKTPGCTIHLLDITSTVAQQVWVTVHTWEDRMMATTCKESGFQHIAYGSWSSAAKGFQYGSQPMPVATFTAGQTQTLRVEMNFSSLKIAKDWSVVVYGEKAGGTVSIKHRNGWTSDKLPVIASGSPPSPSASP